VGNGQKNRIRRIVIINVDFGLAESELKTTFLECLIYTYNNLDIISFSKSLELDIGQDRGSEALWAKYTTDSNKVISVEV